MTRFFGRVPVDLVETLKHLSHLEGHVFLVLTTICVRDTKYGNQGCVNIPKGKLAEDLGLNRTSLRRAINGLVEAGLLLTESEGCPNAWIVVKHYTESMVHHEPTMVHQEPETVHHEPSDGSSGTAQSSQLQPSVDVPEPFIGRTDVKEKKKRGKRAAKAAPPHPLNGLVTWDQEGRRIRFHDRSREFIRGRLLDIAKEEGLKHLLDDGEMHEGLSRLNGHLMGNPFKTNPKTLPAIVLNWFETDLRRKNNNPQRGKPLAQRIEEKTIERMRDDGIVESGEEIAGFSQQLLETGNIRFNR